MLVFTKLGHAVNSTPVVEKKAPPSFFMKTTHQKKVVKVAACLGKENNFISTPDSVSVNLLDGKLDNDMSIHNSSGSPFFAESQDVLLSLCNYKTSINKCDSAEWFSPFSDDDF